MRGADPFKQFRATNFDQDQHMKIMFPKSYQRIYRARLLSWVWKIAVLLAVLAIVGFVLLKSYSPKPDYTITETTEFSTMGAQKPTMRKVYASPEDIDPEEDIDAFFEAYQRSA